MFFFLTLFRCREPKKPLWLFLQLIQLTNPKKKVRKKKTFFTSFSQKFGGFLPHVFIYFTGGGKLIFPSFFEFCFEHGPLFKKKKKKFYWFSFLQLFFGLQKGAIFFFEKILKILLSVFNFPFAFQFFFFRPKTKNFLIFCF